jgi:hypothetical protein
VAGSEQQVTASRIVEWGFVERGGSGGVWFDELAHRTPQPSSLSSSGEQILASFFAALASYTVV